MATLCHSYQDIYAIAAINIFFILLVDYSVTATGNAENEVVGLSAHLIRRNSQYGDFSKHKDKEFSRRLIGSDKPGASLSTILKTSKISPQHIMKLSIGTPPTDIYLVADTGSDLLWTDCQPCLNCTAETLYPQYDREKSSTYRNMSCSAEDCRYFEVFLKPFDYANDYCKQDPEQTCVYHNEYVDKAYSEGFLAKETITMTTTKGKPVALPNITVGCGINNSNPSPIPTDNRTDSGLIGLGGGSLSFVSQIAPYVGGRRFSHCLVPHTADPIALSKIYFGSGSELVGEEVVSTPLVVKDEHGGYHVKVAGMTIEDEFVSFKHTNGTMLDMVVDSGTPVSRLPQPSFDQVRDLLIKKIGPKYEPKILEREGERQLCLNTSTYPQEEILSTLHFEGGELPLTVDQLFYIDPDNGKLCFSIMHDEKMNLDYGYFGGLSQSNLWIGYDLDKKMMTFKHADCLK